MYSLVQLNLVYRFKKSIGEVVPSMPLEGQFSSESEYPFVTIQLPVFNELYVVERLIDCVCNLDYPSNRMEIQVLDDSTDESFEIAAKKVQEWKDKGVDIVHVKRPERIGFKAGALAYGLKIAKGDFTAIFDADFIPNSDFLYRTMPHFSDPKVGLVQTKWEHLNEHYSMLTRLQAFGLDAHFSVEQKGRNAGNHFINFNGTAGVWRNDCIDDAGGWQSDTLTEDLDLSYRAQLKKWKFQYLEKTGAPAELPVAMNALKNQQYRWTKGAAECAVKNLPKVLKTKKLGLGTKIHAIFHLMNSFIFICILTTAVLSVPMIWVKYKHDDYALVFQLASIFLLSFFILAYFYWVSMSHSKVNKKESFAQFLMLFPMFLSVSMGMSLHNAIAVIEGYIGRKTPFVRTPKFNLALSGNSIKNNKYASHKIKPLTLVEFLLTIYFIGGIGLAFYTKDFGLVPFHLMLTIGFGFVTFFSIKHSRT
ncbi:MAG: cellulose synthase/poly-beta-1,6-N-acetylglucosamine synthase-like glycosyltransferase [Patiriisocius sp.]|jgi:cellulose synthase/poly-beta-1,6-N-acetylglucosamine synthase-like glycosyltransferase